MQRSISETTEENIAYTKEITNLLSKLNLEVKSLPNDIQEGLKKISSILRSEKLFEFDEAALSVNRERKIVEEKRQQREEKQMSVMYNKLLRNCTKLQTKLDNLQEAVDSLKNSDDIAVTDKNEMFCNKAFLSTKLGEYQQTAEKLETQLTEMQVDNIYPEQIIEKYNLYLQNRSKLADLNQLIAQYNDLPPDLLQAKLLVESKEKEYENLERMFLN